MTDDMLWQEIFSLREQLKIAVKIIKGCDPELDVSDFLHRLKSVDYAQWMEELQDAESINKGGKGMKTLADFYTEYRKGCNPITGESNLFGDITDRMIWDAAQEETIKEIDNLKSQITALSRHLAEACDIIYKAFQICDKKYCKECNVDNNDAACDTCNYSVLKTDWIKSLVDANNGAGWREILKAAEK